ncbi:MAG: hypothetical protein COV44_08105 [Deltaproteobacteria bacterium CG11_big_fil_rev_8_21_14_0_20_45_16]|nr:MAG: hypothetical protein COV44_08105 [Deltaproteobacteria bacterium CG11_big_fil_rev_8_21_14_0_20_45_16]
MVDRIPIGGAVNQQLPGLDLGFWNTTQSGDEACSSAQLGALVNQHTKAAFFAQQLGTAGRCFMQNAGISFPASTAEADNVEFLAAELTDFGFTNAEGDIVAFDGLSVSKIEDSDSNSGFKYDVTGTVVDNTGDPSLSYCFSKCSDFDRLSWKSFLVDRRRGGFWL